MTASKTAVLFFRQFNILGKKLNKKANKVINTSIVSTIASSVTYKQKVKRYPEEIKTVRSNRTFPTNF